MTKQWSRVLTRHEPLNSAKPLSFDTKGAAVAVAFLVGISLLAGGRDEKAEAVRLPKQGPVSMELKPPVAPAASTSVEPETTPPPRRAGQ